MERTKLQQIELDKVEKHVLITLFGKEAIPEKTSIALRMMNINPNDIIKKFENLMIPIMKDDGIIDGKMLKKILQISKYNEIAHLFTIPDADFFLSDIYITAIKDFIPGVIL